MVVVKLMGGLGNQMFQYAFGITVATKLQKNLVLDVDFLLDRSPKSNFVYRDFDLDIFQLNSYGFYDVEHKEKFKKKTLFSKGSFVFLEKGFHFQEFDRVLKFSKVYLEGYWQSYKYFEGIEGLIRQEFTFKQTLNPIQQELLDQIKSTKSICVNFRRTDFVTIPTAIQTHGVPSLRYYKDALSALTDVIGTDVSLFIFSDDIDWCKANFQTNYPAYFVDHATYKGDRFSVYLNLMSHCKHFIIPNSTFAWWGAWLSTNPSKLVFTPEKWFSDELLQNQTYDLRPSSWITL